MEQLIRKINRQLCVTYILLWVSPVLFLAIPGITGVWADQVRTCYLFETMTILFTAVCVPLSLKLFAWAIEKRINPCSTEQALHRYLRWSLLRLLLIGLPEVIGFVTYVLCLSYTGLLCALICLVASLFCIPSQKTLRSHLHIEE